MRLDHAFWPDVEKYLGGDDRLLLPTGSVEQHGPAVATGIDYIIANAVAGAAAERLGVYCAPPLCYGVSLHHAAFPGTVSLKPSVYLVVVKDLFVFTLTQGFRRIVVVNGHGGNFGTLTAAALEVSYEYEGVKVAIQNWYDVTAVAKRIGKEFGTKEGSHATPGETSVLMYLKPELVGDVSEVKLTEARSEKTVYSPRDLRSRYPQGAVASEPALASPEIGKELFELAVEGVIEVMERL